MGYPDAPDENGHDCWTRGYGDPELYLWLQSQENASLVENGLNWAREQMRELMLYTCATTIQCHAKVDPFAFKQGLKKATVTASRWNARRFSGGALKIPVAEAVSAPAAEEAAAPAAEEAASNS